MSDIINLYLNQLILSILLSLNTVNQNTLNYSDIRLIEEGTVTRVVDGDTIEVFENNQVSKIRLIGVNTPETLDPRKEVECFGIEASMFLKKELEGKKVKLEADKTQTDKDTYGRDLRYVFLNETNINKKIIEEGYGFEFTYKKPYVYQEDFKKVEKLAKENKKGLWDSTNCNY
jgi:micrococcal nuclease